MMGPITKKRLRIIEPLLKMIGMIIKNTVSWQLFMQLQQERDGSPIASMPGLWVQGPTRIFTNNGIQNNPVDKDKS